MEIFGGNMAITNPKIVLVPLLLALAAPKRVFAGFTKPLRDVPDQLGTGNLAMDAEWSLFGLLGLAAVVGLLAVFYRRDKEQ